MPPAAVNPGNAKVNDDKNTALMVAVRDGDLERVQQILAALPGYKAARLDLANKFGLRAIHYAAKGGHLEILNALAAAGANINVRTLKGSTPLVFAVFHNKHPIVQRLIALGADVNLGGAKTIPIHMALGFELNETGPRTLYLIAYDLLEAGAILNDNLDFDLNAKTLRILDILDMYLSGIPVVNGVFADSVINLLRILIEKKPALIIDYWNLMQHEDPVPYEYITEALARAGDIPLMRTALENGLILVHPDKPVEGIHILLAAEDGIFTPEMNELILEFAPPPPPPPPPGQMWKGWTRGDLGKFDIIFDADNAHQFSICPVCFKFVERREGCMYMHHNCLQEKEVRGGFVHTQIYEKYSGADGEIWWCTVCGRICNGHTHYELLPPFIDRPTTVHPDHGANLFGNECLGANKGGGKPEKVARFRRAREYALELQGQIDQITEDRAMKELVEEMWVAPIARYERRAQQILQQGRFNIPNTNFPPNVVAAANANANAPAPNVNRPQANRNDPALRPEVVQEADMMNVMTMNDIPRGIKFHHRKPDGTLYHHEAPIGRPGFISWFGGDGGMARNFADARFGRCFDVDCGAVLYPQELEPFVDTAEEEKFIPRDLFETYKANFNRHMPARLAPRAAQGGSKRVQKTRKAKGNKRKQRGGQAHDMFLELDLGQCLLPRKAKGGYIKNRKTKRKNRR
jgi:hypothetical protein